MLWVKGLVFNVLGCMFGVWDSGFNVQCCELKVDKNITS